MSVALVRSRSLVANVTEPLTFKVSPAVRLESPSAVIWISSAVFIDKRYLVTSNGQQRVKIVVSIGHRHITRAGTNRQRKCRAVAGDRAVRGHRTTQVNTSNPCRTRCARERQVICERDRGNKADRRIRCSDVATKTNQAATGLSKRTRQIKVRCVFNRQRSGLSIATAPLPVVVTLFSKRTSLVVVISMPLALNELPPICPLVLTVTPNVVVPVPASCKIDTALNDMASETVTSVADAISTAPRRPWVPTPTLPWKAISAPVAPSIVRLLVSEASLSTEPVNVTTPVPRVHHITYVSITQYPHIAGVQKLPLITISYNTAKVIEAKHSGQTLGANARGKRSG